MIGEASLRSICVALLGLLPCLPCPVAASEVSIATFSYEPYSFQEGDEVAGIAVDLARVALGRLNHDTRFVVYPPARAIALARSGRYQALLPIRQTPEDARDFLFPGAPLLQQVMALFSPVDAAIPFDGTPESLAGKHIAILRESTISPAFDVAALGGTLYLHPFDTPETVLQVVALKRMHLAALDLFVGLRTARRAGIDNRVVPLQPVIRYTPSFLAFSRKGASGLDLEALARALGPVLVQMEREGVRDSLVQHYTNHTPTQ